MIARAAEASAGRAEGPPTGVCRKIADLFRARTGARESVLSHLQVEQGIRAGMAKAGIEETQTYLHALADGRIALDGLIEQLVSGETSFFRHPEHFEFFHGVIVPALLDQYGRGHTIRGWSAGCATGEEAYSLGIALQRESLAGGWVVYGTDICRSFLHRAQAGVYADWSVRGSLEHVDPYLRRVDNRWVVAEVIKRKTRFSYLNLAEPSYPSVVPGIFGFDIIMCCNVLIYLGDDVIALTAERLFQSLAPGGWLLIAPSDPPLEKFADYEIVEAPGGLFYYRRPVNARLEEQAHQVEAHELPPTGAAQERSPAPLILAPTQAPAHPCNGSASPSATIAVKPTPDTPLAQKGGAAGRGPRPLQLTPPAAGTGARTEGPAGLPEAQQSQFLVVRASGRRWALPMSCVREVLTFEGLTKIPGLPRCFAGVVVVRGEVVAAVDLALLLGWTATEPSAVSRFVVVGGVQIEFGILAEEAGETRALDAMHLEPPLPEAGNLTQGLTADGVAVLDPQGLLSDPRIYA